MRADPLFFQEQIPRRYGCVGKFEGIEAGPSEADLKALGALRQSGAQLHRSVAVDPQEIADVRTPRLLCVLLPALRDVVRVLEAV